MGGETAAMRRLLYTLRKTQRRATDVPPLRNIGQISMDLGLPSSDGRGPRLAALDRRARGLAANVHGLAVVLAKVEAPLNRREARRLLAPAEV